MTMLSIKFEFRAHEYHALVRIREKDSGTEYYVTVMDGVLERLLYGNHVPVLENGMFKSDLSSDTQLGSLKSSIADAMNEEAGNGQIMHYFE